MVSYCCYGGVAQLGERLNGIQEVMGSIPTISTKNKASHPKGWGALLFNNAVGIEQGVKKQSGGDSPQCGEMSQSDKGDGSVRLFFSRGNEQSEAIGAGSTETNPHHLHQE